MLHKKDIFNNTAFQELLLVALFDQSSTDLGSLFYNFLPIVSPADGNCSKFVAFDQMTTKISKNIFGMKALDDLTACIKWLADGNVSLKNNKQTSES